MKNKIFILIAIIFSFFITNNVKASEEYVLGVLEEDSDAYNFIANTSNLPTTIHDHIFIGNDGGDSYSVSDDYVYLLTFTDKYRPYIASASGYSYFSLFDDEQNIYTNRHTSDFEDIDVYYLSYDSEINAYSWVLQDSVQMIFYYYGASALTSKYFHSTEYYKSDFTTIANEANIELGPQLPTINLSLEDSLFDDDGNVIQKKIVVDWGIKDTSKYQYMFKSNSSDNWKYFFSDDQQDEILVNMNDTYILQVNDLDNNYITGAAVNITGLKENLPTLKLIDYTGAGCYFQNQKYCAILSLYSESADFSKYTLQYRFSDGEWVTHNYDNSAKGQIQIYENTSIAARLIRNSDNQIVDAASYTIASINTDVSLDIPEFKFSKTFCTNLDTEGFHEIGNGNYKQTLKMTIYGLDMTKYRVFFSIDHGNSFNEITQFEYEDRVPLVKYYYFEYYQDTTFIVKITDLEGNYVTGTAYTLHFTCNDINLKLDEFQDMNDIFKHVTDFFNKFKDIMLKFKEVIEYFYNSMNDEIKGFILTAFIIIVVTGLIMRMMK